MKTLLQNIFTLFFAKDGVIGRMKIESGIRTWTSLALTERIGILCEMQEEIVKDHETE